MRNRTGIFTLLVLAFTLLMSLPWLVPHCGWTALAGLLPLLILERLAAEYKGLSDTNRATQNSATTLNCAVPQDFFGKLFQMHQVIFEYACKTYQGDSQILSHVQSFWEYLEPSIPKKIFKKIKKAGKLSEYQAAIIEISSQSSLKTVILERSDGIHNFLKGKCRLMNEPAFLK